MLHGIVLLSALCLGPAPGAETGFSFREVGTTGLELLEDGRPVYVYNYGMLLPPGAPENMRRSSYLHPVYAPDGTVLTDDFNPNHMHHRGISWMWPEIHFGGKRGDIWTLDGFQQRFVGWKSRATTADTARLELENGWFDGDRQFVREQVEIVAHPAVKQQQRLDFTLTFEAIDQPVQVRGTLQDDKGFGGFCFRYAPRDGGDAGTVIRTDEGLAADDGVMSPHPWAEVTGVFQGKAAGARIEDDSANPGYPHNGWLMRHHFGFLNVSYPGRETITLEPGKPLVLKYHVLLFAGESDQVGLDAKAPLKRHD